MNRELVYSEVMEDDAPIRAALELGPEDAAVVVASAGDNVFHAAMDGAPRVVGVDVSAVQIDFCRLKAAAAARLPWRDFALLIGSLPGSAERRAALLEDLPGEMVAGALGNGPNRAVAYEHGLAACGGLAAFVAPLREGLRAVVGPEVLERILSEPDPGRRGALWNERFETPEVTGFFAAALNAETIGDTLMPRVALEQPSPLPFHAFYHRALKRLLVERDPTRNEFLHRLWGGRYPSPEVAPRYLREAHFAELQDALPRITWRATDLTALLAEEPAESLHAINASNVADWMEDEAYRALWAELTRVAAPGARVFLRSFLADRPPPSAEASAWRTDPRQNERLTDMDRVGYFARCELWRKEG